MSDTVIRVENLGKKYILGQQQQGQYRYTALRDAIADGTKSLGRKLLSPFGKSIPKPAREEFWALKDVSFEVKQGDRVGIIGRNGAGKSTLLKILSRITEPTTGRITTKGRVASLLEVGTGFHPELTGRENIYLNGAILGMSRVEIKNKFDEIVTFAEVEKFLDTSVKHYSSGMYVRLAFAVAAHLETEILIVDEVLAVGDISFQKKCLGKMENVASQGRTVMFVSHNLSAIRKLCRLSFLLNKGKIEIQGSTEVVLSKYIEYGAGKQSVYKIKPPINEDTSAYAHKLTVEDVQGNPVAAIPVGQLWQIRVHYTVTRKLEHFIIGLGFRTSEESALRTCWSKPCSLIPGEYQAIFREDTIILGPSRYSLIVGISNFNQVLHYVEDAGFLEIAEFSEGIDLLKVSGIGIILNPLKVEIYKSDHY